MYGSICKALKESEYYVKCYNQYGLDVFTEYFSTQREAEYWAQEAVRRGHYSETAVYEPLNDECIDVYDQDWLKMDTADKLNLHESVGDPINFDRTDETFKYTGSYTDNDMKRANSLSEMLYSVGKSALELIKDGKIIDEKQLYNVLQYGSDVNSGARVYGSGFSDMYQSNLMRDILYKTKAADKLYAQMKYWEDKCYDALRKQSTDNGGVK